MRIRYTIGTNRADDWICTSICRLTKPVPSGSSHVGDMHEREESNPVKQFWRLPALPGAHSCIAALREKSSQGIRRELNPYLLVHSQACSDRYNTDTMSISSPTRTRTWNTLLEARDDGPFHHRAVGSSCRLSAVSYRLINSVSLTAYGC